MRDTQLLYRMFVSDLHHSESRQNQEIFNYGIRNINYNKNNKIHNTNNNIFNISNIN